MLHSTSTKELCKKTKWNRNEDNYNMCTCVFDLNLLRVMFAACCICLMYYCLEDLPV